jgi:hypothetical protein
LATKTAKPPNFDPLRFSPPPKPPVVEPSSAERHARIARAAYLRAERREFAPGHEVEDWLAAESEVDGQLAEARRGGRPEEG